MTKNDDKKISKIGSSSSTKGVGATESVSEIDRVKEAKAVRGVSGVSGVGKTGAIASMSFEQRERLMSIVTQEAEKLAASGAIPKSQREIVEQAVKMVIDAALLEPLEGSKKK